MSETLKDIAKKIRATGKSRRITVRKLLAAIGQERRGKHVTSQLNMMLMVNGLDCNPGFENTHFDAPVILSQREGPCAADLDLDETEDESGAEIVDSECAEVDSDQDTESPLPGADSEKEEARIVPGEQESPRTTIAIEISLPADEIEAREVVMTVRQGIPAGGRIPALIRRQEPVFRALSQMNDGNLGELVVTNGERGMVEGIFSWQSYGKAKLAGKPCETVADCLSREFGEVREDKPLFDTVREVIRHGVVVVRARDGCLCGLVTLRDVADVFVELSEPFLFLGQIENHLRELVERMRLTPDQLRALADERDVARAAGAAKVDDFTLGELIRAIQNPEYWAKLGLNHDRTILLQRMDRVRQIRNKVMHFDADGLLPADKSYLTETRRILQDL